MPSLLPVIITVSLTPAEYRPFASAVHRLRRILGTKAPDAGSLIHANLRGRDARGLAEDYLDAIGWPHDRRRPKRAKVRSHAAWARAGRIPADPSRN